MTLMNFTQALKQHDITLEPVTNTRRLRGTVGMAQPKQCVHPENIQAVQEIQKAARKNKITLWVSPNSAGNGLLAPDTKSEPVLVDLSRLDKILAVDADSAYALVEPGVSYGQLREWLEKKDLKMWLDSGRSDNDSILGGIWERSFGYSVYGDHLMMQCGFEVILADGTQLRTGMGAFPKGDCWQLFKYGFGPYMDGSFTQSDFGIPTKVGFWISPEPPAYRPFAMRIADESTFIAAVEAVRDLRINMVVPNTITLLDKGSDTTLYGGDPSGWNIYGALYGLPKNVDLVWGMLNGLAQKLGKAELQDISKMQDNGAIAHSALMRGEATQQWEEFEASVDSRYLRLVFALPIEGEIALQFASKSKSIAQTANCNVTIEQGTSWRALLAEVLLTYEANTIENTISCGKTMIQEWAQQGVGVVRADPVFRQAAADTYSDQGSNQLQRLVQNALRS